MCEFRYASMNFTVPAGMVKAGNLGEDEFPTEGA
jgi:hypothetical protein